MPKITFTVKAKIGDYVIFKKGKGAVGQIKSFYVNGNVVSNKNPRSHLYLHYSIASIPLPDKLFKYTYKGRKWVDETEIFDKYWLDDDYEEMEEVRENEIEVITEQKYKKHIKKLIAEIKKDQELFDKKIETEIKKAEELKKTEKQSVIKRNDAIETLIEWYSHHNTSKQKSSK